MGISSEQQMRREMEDAASDTAFREIAVRLARLAKGRAASDGDREIVGMRVT